MFTSSGPSSRLDAAIIEACRALGCDVVLSEDLGAGEDYAGVRVENPFTERYETRQTGRCQETGR